MIHHQKQAHCWPQWIRTNLVEFFYTQSRCLGRGLRQWSHPAEAESWCCSGPLCRCPTPCRSPQFGRTEPDAQSGKHTVTRGSYSALLYLCCAACGSWFCSTWARCKKEVCLLSADTKWRAMGSFLAARHSGRFSSDEASQRSQCLAKLRISDKRLMENCDTLHGSLVDWLSTHHHTR